MNGSKIDCLKELQFQDSDITFLWAQVSTFATYANKIN